MKLKKLIRHLKPPCHRCPYKLGLVQMVVNPCPQCKANGYRSYDQFKMDSSET